MAQGKLKSKTKLPDSVKSKKGSKKGNAVTKRANRPVQSKKKGITDARKLKQIITKTVNKSLEDEIRAAAASENQKSLSKAQQAVVDHHSKSTTGAS